MIFHLRDFQKRESVCFKEMEEMDIFESGGYTAFVLFTLSSPLSMQLRESCYRVI